MTNENKIQAIKDSMDEYISKLCKELEEGHTESFQTYLSFVSRFHHYSVNNMMMILAQRPTATRVAGFHDWKKLGRSVKKGEKGLKILAPRTSKRKSEDGEEEIVRYFVAVTVFDISQTEGEDLPSWNYELSDDHQDLYGRLKTIMQDQGIVVEELPIPNGALGVSYGGRVVIKPDLDPMNKALTLIHEFAHEILHKGSENQALSRGLKECEAEATTYIVASYFGEESPMSRDYLLSWKNGGKELKERLESIIKASQEIINLLSHGQERVENTIVTEEKNAA